MVCAPLTCIPLIHIHHKHLLSPFKIPCPFLPKPTTLLTFPPHPPERFKLVAFYSPPQQIPTRNHTDHDSPLTGLTRTIASLVALALSLSKISLLLCLKFQPALKNAINTVAIEVTKPLFFAAISHSSSDLLSTSTPIKVIAAGVARGLEIYNGVLLIRVLLSWFPNIPWDQQPMSAIRDLSDPYLGLFRGIIPPLFNSLDVSPILAFLLLGLVGQLARPPCRF